MSAPVSHRSTGAQDGGEAGYTLTEMLAALLILGLGLGGALQAGRLIERQQRSSVKTLRTLEAERAARRALDDLLASYRPSGTDAADLQGDETGFQFACGAQTCGVRLASYGDAEVLELRTPRVETVAIGPAARDHFLYVAGSATTPSWPGDTSPSLPLEAIVLDGADHASGPIATTRIWRAEPADCRYDAMTRACRDAPS